MAETLKDAYLLFNRKKYSDVISMLEPQVFRFRENFNFFYLLGMSCLNQGDYGGAFSYLRRAVDIRENDVNTLLGIAAVYLKRGDTGKALKIWLDIIELDPENVFAKRGLNYLRKSGESDDLSDLASSDKIQKFLPQPSKKSGLPGAALLIPAAVFLIIIFAVPVSRDAVIEFAGDLNFLSFLKKPGRPDIPDTGLDTRKDFIDLKGGYIFIFTEKEVEKKFRDIQDYLYEYRDNLAQREINTILLSNASEYVKDRARLLGKYVAVPDLISFKDSFSYSEVKSFPELYEGCYVLWKGKPTNLNMSPEEITFDFLVGYHEEKTLEGVVPAGFDFAIRIVPDQPIELLGRIRLDPQNSVSLDGVAVRLLK